MYLADKIAACIEHDFVSSSRALLPGVQDLIIHYGVSRPTILRALHLLRDRGLIEVAPRVRAKVSGTTAPPSAAVENVVSHLRKKILGGSLRTGMPLPKIGHTAAQTGSSAPTAALAYRQLAGEGLFRKIGQRWVISGMEPRGAGTKHPTGTIILLLRSRHDWNCLSTPRTHAFYFTVQAEAQRLGIGLMPVYVTQLPDALYGAHGIAEIRQLTRRLGTNYLGALVPLRRDMFSEFEIWVNDLLGLDGPVVWFDAIDDPLHSPRLSSRFFRCHFCEAPAIALAMQTLARYGHKKVLCPTQRDQDWHANRLAIIEREARLCKPGLEVISSVNDSTDFYAERIAFTDAIQLILDLSPRSRGDTLRRFVARFPDYRQRLSCIDSATATTEVHDAISREFGLAYFERPPFEAVLATASMLKRIRTGPFTAIVAPNDTAAIPLFNWLCVSGFEVPKDVSMVSFDNTPGYQFLPVSTIDFGFGFLGYWAIHALVGDLPVPADRLGNIAARPQLIDRSSIGRPGEPLCESLERRMGQAGRFGFGTDLHT